MKVVLKIFNWSDLKKGFLSFGTNLVQFEAKSDPLLTSHLLTGQRLSEVRGQTARGGAVT